MPIRCNDSVSSSHQVPALTAGICVFLAQICHLANDPARAADTATADTATTEPVQEVVVVGTAVLPNSDMPLNEVPANVQQVGGDRLAHEKPLNISDALNKMVGSINVNDTQGNPFQPDVNFRGFTASPVLGTPQGISVFVDGVRMPYLKFPRNPTN